MIGVSWPGKAGGAAAAALFDKNIYNSFRTAGLLSEWLKTIQDTYSVSMFAHSAGNVAMLESLRLLDLTGRKRIKSVITSEAATFQNVFGQSLSSYDPFSTGTFDNVSHNGIFRGAVDGISGQYSNFYSANDHTLWLTLCELNENVNFINPDSFPLIMSHIGDLELRSALEDLVVHGKGMGHPRTVDDRRILEGRGRTPYRLSYEIPGTHSWGSDNDGHFWGSCIMFHQTPALGSAPVPVYGNQNCEDEGYGIRNNGGIPFVSGRNPIAGSHGFMRDDLYDNTYRYYRKLVSLIQ